MDREDSPDQLAKTTFLITIVGAALYVLAVYFFVLTADPGEPDAPAETQHHD